MSKFAQLGLSGQLIKALEKSGYDSPTPIQEKVIPFMLQGNDIVAISQTGTGKTAAFVLPILERLRANQHKAVAKHCSTLIIVPTRELAKQIDDNIQKYGEHISHQRACVVGGVKYPQQVKRLHQGLDILVATPGRLEDHLKSGNLFLDHVEALILDEADQMLDLGFFPAIRRIAQKTPRTRQTVLLSATMPEPIRKLATELLNNPKDVAVAPPAKPVERIEQVVMLIKKQDKLGFLITALENQFRTIIFTRTKHGANQLVKQLSKHNIAADAIHGDKSQNQRQRTLEAFRKGELHILVATDIAARGIDVPDVSLVANYDVPTKPDSYVHRIGRTARAGRAGQAITLCAPEERKHLRDIEKQIGMKLRVENVNAGGVDEEGYEPLKVLIEPSEKSVRAPVAKPVVKTDRKDGAADHPRKSRRRKNINKGEAKKEGFGGSARKKSGSGKAKKRHDGDANAAEKQGAGVRKKRGNKNPPRGPAGNRLKNRHNSRNSKQPTR